MKSIDKLYTQDETETFELPEFILACLNYQHQAQNSLVIHYQTPTLTSQQSTSNIPSDYLGSISTSEQIRGNPFNPPPPNTTERLPYWTTQPYSQGDPNLVNELIDIS